MPATETTDFEREFEQLVQDLRALPTAAPEHLRQSVRALGEPAQPPTLWDRLRVVSWRRSLLVLAPVCVLGLVSAAVIHGVLHSAPQREATATTRSAEALQGSQGSTGKGSRTLAPTFGAATDSTLKSPLPVPAPGRYQDYEAWMRVRVQDLDALSERTNEAMRIVRSYGGYVASVEESSAAGQPGQADLVLRVPVARVEDALVRLTRLGTVVERHMAIRDLEQVVQQQRARILKLKVFIARATETLKGSLPADVRLRLQLQLEEAKRNLARTTSANKATLREASLSRISLTLTTQKAVGGATKGGPGRIERAARDAASFLAAAGAILLFLLIVLSPLIVLALATVWGTRAYRRREERRLLAQT
jgi:negative regulator of sigma E activity